MPVTNDADLEPSWSKDAVFALPEIASIPDVAGVFILVRGPDGEDVVWAEAPDDLRFRARELAGHATVGPDLGAILQFADLRFRYTTIDDYETRQRVLGAIRERMTQVSSGSIGPPW